MREIRIKASSINPSSCFAERELTLSDIDSMYHNGEISLYEAQAMVIKIAADSTMPREILLAAFGK